MMDPMRFRSLYEITEPAGGLDVPMVEILRDGGKECVIGGSLKVAAEHGVNDRAAEERIKNNFDWMLIEAGENFDTPRGVMKLVAKTPEELRFVPEPVPPVINESRHKVGDSSGGKIVDQAIEVNERRLRQPAVPALSGEDHNAELD